MTALTELSVIDFAPCHAGRAAELEALSFSSPWNEKMLLDSLDHGIFLVCVKNGTLLGYVGSYCVGDEAAITNIAVFPEYKRQGVGEALMKELIKRAEEKGLVQVSLEVRVSNTPAISLYAKLGFEIAGTRRGFYTSPREDAYVLTYDLQRKKV